MGLLEQSSLVITPNAVKTGKLYSAIPNNGTGDLDVVRATSATRVNSAGLIEIPVTNLFLQSDMFANATWSKGQSSVVANSVIAPDGTLAADTLTADGTSAQHAISQAFSTTNGMTYTTSVYAKKNTNNFLQISGFAAGFGATAFVNFDLSNGVLGTIGSGSNGSIQSVGDGWYRCVATFTATATASAGLLFFMITSATSIRGESNTLSTSVYLWGAQLQEGVTATEYIPTTSVIRTRFAGITQDGGSASNIPRIDYTNGSCPSILVEPQRTNLCLQSEMFTQSPWAGNTIISANTDIAPNGTLTADTLTDSSTAQFRNLSQTISVSANSTIASSVFIKKTTGTPTNYPSISVQFTGGSARVARLILNTTTGTFTISPDSNITPIGRVVSYNDYWRIEMTTTDNGSNTSAIFRLDPALSSDGTTISLSATGSAVFWGAQFELGSNVTSYIPTTTSSVTRNADLISKNGISNLIGQSKGSLVYYFIKNSNSSIPSITLNNNGTIPRFYPYESGTNYTFFLQGASAILVNYLYPLSNFITGLNKIGITYGAGSFKIYINGSLITSVPYTEQDLSFSKLNIGSSNINGVGNTSSNNLVLINKEILSESEMIQLTTL